MQPSALDALSRRVAARQLTRRSALLGSGTAASALLLSGAIARAQSATPAATRAATPEQQAADILAIVQKGFDDAKLRAVIVRVTVDGQELITEALGESMTGVPATTDMHFRNGAVAISYIAMVLLQLVDQGVVRLDDTIDAWEPELPGADRITLRMLANMTSGYADYVQDAGFADSFFADPFRHLSQQDLLDIALAKPLIFEPGTNWGYAHTNLVILGRILTAVTGKPLATLMQEMIFTPLGLENTTDPGTPEIQQPVLHAFTSERRQAIGVDPEARFYEESTYWNPSWTLAEGAIQTTNIFDMTATAEAIGTGALLTPESHNEMVTPKLLGFGAPLEGCLTCHTLDEAYSYGLGVVLSGAWILQNPLFGGYGAIEAYLPAEKVAIAVATTFAEESFDATTGDYLHKRASWEIFAAIAEYLTPEYAPPASRPG